MNEDYDAIVLGTGLKECILSGLLSTSGKKVLHLDRNDYYGGESTSMDLEQLFHSFGNDDEKGKPPPDIFGRVRDYSVDLAPKFIMACGSLVKIILKTKITPYLDFKKISGSYVYHANGKIYKVPATPQEALTSSLVGLLQKTKFRSFLQFVNQYEVDKPSTHKYDLNKMTMRELFEVYELNQDTIDFVGHALGLYLDDSYLSQPALECALRVQMYAYSLARYGDSPYIYPIWGLGGLPEAFSRLSAVYGGVYMLNKPVDEILYDGDGHVSGIKSQGETARTRLLIGDPSYLIEKRKPLEQVARWLFILDHPIPNSKDCDSCQVILTQRQLGRNSDVYISVVSGVHNVCPSGKWIAMISAKVETDNPKMELEKARRLLGPSLKDFFFVSQRYESAGDFSNQGIYIPSSPDSTTHFETTISEVLSLYERIIGKPFDLSIPVDDNKEQTHSK